MERAPRKAKTLTASLLALTLGLPGSAPVYPDLRWEALRAPAAAQSSGLEQLDQALRSRPAAGAEEWLLKLQWFLEILEPILKEVIRQKVDVDRALFKHAKGLEASGVSASELVPILYSGSGEAWFSGQIESTEGLAETRLRIIGGLAAVILRLAGQKWGRALSKDRILMDYYVQLGNREERQAARALLGRDKEKHDREILEQLIRLFHIPLADQEPPPSAGAEEVRRIDAEEFFGEYHPALKMLSPSRQEEIFRWMDYDGFEIREVTLPNWVKIYVRGKELMGELLPGIRNPEGVVFDWKLLPLAPGENWERIGLILNDLNRHGVYDGDNPNGLRIYDVQPGEAPHLNAALLLAEALSTLPPGAVLLGAELLPDTRGRVRLILFSA